MFFLSYCAKGQSICTLKTIIRCVHLLITTNNVAVIRIKSSDDAMKMQIHIRPPGVSLRQLTKLHSLTTTSKEANISATTKHLATNQKKI